MPKGKLICKKKIKQDTTKIKVVLIQPCNKCPELSQTNHELRWRNKQLESENSKSWAKQCFLTEQKYQDLLKEYWALRRNNTSLIEKSSQEKNISQRSVNIPKEANFIQLFYDKEHKKFVLYSCHDSCWTGKHCNNCAEYSKWSF